MNPAAIPWDFVLILALLATIVPWRGAVRMKRLLSKPELNTSDRLSLYGSTIFLQWTITALVAWRTSSRMMSLEELGLTTGNSWRVVWASFLLTALLCLSQVVSLRRIARLPEGERGSLFAITEKIMPRTATETCVYVGLACTAGISEEFLYRGFVFATFSRIFAKIEFSAAAAMLLSSLWFSLAHFYQGPRGLVTTFVVGTIFASIRIWTGSLIPAVAGHIGVDLVAGLLVSRILRGAR